MATIRKRGNKYQAQVRRKGFDTQVRTFHLLKDAQEWARLQETLADRHELPTNKKALEGVTLGKLVERYRDEVLPRMKGGTNETINLNAILRHPICKKSLAELGTKDFAKFRDDKLQTVTAKSLQRILSPIKHLLNMAKDEWGYPLRENPLDRLRLKTTDNKRERRLRPGEIDQLLLCAAGKEKREGRGHTNRKRNPYVIVIVEFALETALRRGEILALRWADVDIERQSATVQESKNGYSRTIPLTPKAIDLVNRAKAIAMGDGDKEPDLSASIFPLTPNGFRLAWERLVKRAKITDLHFHDLRHEAISRLFEKGLTVPEVASISGHRDARMLFRYAHANQSAVRAKLGAGLVMENKETYGV
tara:strand:- start:4013 stop:5101 length:1089 start_codon:yes stop_codon:yes gene_type:complete